MVYLTELSQTSLEHPRGDVEEGFVTTHVVLKDYFDAMLKHSAISFDTKLLGYRGAEIDTTFIWDKIPNLPSIAEIKNGYILGGIAYLDSIYTNQKQYNSTPFTSSFIDDFTDWVAWKKDPEYTARKWLFQKTINDYSTSAWHTYSLAYFALKAGDTLLAKEQYKIALDKLKTDTDPKLTPSTRARIIKRSNDQLRELR